MSFHVYARRVRDPGLPVERRGSALGSAVVLYCPFGFHLTHTYLSHYGDTRRDPQAMTAALAALQRSRDAYIAEWEAFSRRRKHQKRTAHRRTPSAADQAWMSAPRWPGPDLHHAHHTLVRHLTTAQDFPAHGPLEEELSRAEKAVTTHAQHYLATNAPGIESAPAMEPLLPALRAAAGRYQGQRGVHSPETQAERLWLTAELIHADTTRPHTP
ncbi:hypothetical protein ABT160_30010 [Streptomyces sp. NPDC001941]|uniref:hypothetical protein n=1 Tax=Streptomyces sp. NPDC001941 TaxID=3154659 RepID=UPI00332D03A5